MIVVTGGGGHLGSNLVRALTARGEQVRVVGIGPADGFAGTSVELVQADVRDREAVARAFKGADVVYHLAAVISLIADPRGVLQSVNVDGARIVAEEALKQGVRRMVHFSSVHAFDLQEHGSLIDEDHPRAGAGAPGYDRSKADGEQAVRDVVAQGLDAVILNPSGVIGPEDSLPSRMGRFFRDYRSGGNRLMLQGGFDWVDVRDVVASALSAAEHGRTGESYILSGHWLDVGELAELAAEVAGAKGSVRVVPARYAKPWAALATLYGRLTGVELALNNESLAALLFGGRFSHAKAARELGHNPRPLKQTVADLYASFDATG